MRLPLSKRRGALALGLGLLIMPGRVRAADIVPGVMYAIGEKFDGSFNEGAFRGVEAFRQRSGADYLEYQPDSIADAERGIAALARRGATDITAVGFYYADPVTQLAPTYDTIRFNLIDAVAQGDNVRSITFREQEGCFLTGILAAMASRTGKVGFIGAIDIPLIRRFVAGYSAGAKHARPDVEVIVNFVGTTPAAFNDPTAAGELAKGQFGREVDVVFAGAGNSNMGIFQAAADAKRLAIGVDSNQNGLFPGTVLTSMLKRVDVAVGQTLTDAQEGRWEAGVLSLGLAEDAVGWALDENNVDLITPEMRAAVDAASDDILAGRITVPDGTAS